MKTQHSGGPSKLNLKSITLYGVKDYPWRNEMTVNNQLDSPIKVSISAWDGSQSPAWYSIDTGGSESWDRDRDFRGYIVAVQYNLWAVEPGFARYYVFGGESGTNYVMNITGSDSPNVTLNSDHGTYLDLSQSSPVDN
ncbi:hypothetical protein [Granulicella mallensis]|nr:hypothetical protein [Granulicella mallensis]